MSSKNKKQQFRTLQEQGFLAFLLGWLFSIIAFSF